MHQGKEKNVIEWQGREREREIENAEKVVVEIAVIIAVVVVVFGKEEDKCRK